MEIQKQKSILKDQSTPNQEEKSEPTIIVWKNKLRYGYIHMAAGYGLYLLLIGQVQWRTVLWAQIFFILGILGITAGAHRYWSHKAFKAKTPLRIILALMQTIAFQNSIYDWVRDHRVHHKFSETNADPHNAKRGFFFAHIGWLLCRKHPDVKRDGKSVDMSDLAKDPIIVFQMRHYFLIVLSFGFVIPYVVPCICWGESWAASWFFGVMFRYCASLHAVFSINSFAHLWGSRPYDANINSAEVTSVSIATLGEGWHNYHHIFPWDYKAAEIGASPYNLTTAFIDFFAWNGWAYDLKTVSKDMILRRVERTGDGSYKGWGIKEGNSYDYVKVHG